MIETLSESDFKNKVSCKDKVLVMLSYDWCGSCRKLKEMLDKVSAFEEKVIDIEFIHLDLSETSQQFDKIFAIDAVPTTLFFKKSNLINVHVGVPRSEKVLTELILSCFKNEV